MRIETELFADYFQIGVADRASGGELPSSWDPSASASRMATLPHSASMLCARNSTVAVTFETLDGPPPSGECDHSVEGTVLVGSGSLALFGASDALAGAAVLPVSPGPCRVRFTCLNLSSVSEDGLAGNDSYLVQAWPDPEVTGVTVLKQWMR